MRVELALVPIEEGQPRHRLVFEMPGVPQVGDCVTISRPGQSGNTEFIVRRILWTLNHPQSGPAQHAGEIVVGTATAVVAECEFVAGPYSFEEHKVLPVSGVT